MIILKIDGSVFDDKVGTEFAFDEGTEFKDFQKLLKLCIIHKKYIEIMFEEDKENG